MAAAGRASGRGELRLERDRAGVASSVSGKGRPRRARAGAAVSERAELRLGQGGALAGAVCSGSGKGRAQTSSSSSGAEPEEALHERAWRRAAELGRSLRPRGEDAGGGEKGTVLFLVGRRAGGRDGRGRWRREEDAGEEEGKKGRGFWLGGEEEEGEKGRGVEGVRAPRCPPPSDAGSQHLEQR